MREIKFRAWDKREKKMLSWEEIRLENAGILLATSENLIPLQFTGLKDKNGKEIFKGDIILIKTGALTFKKETKCEVEFYRGSFIAKGEPLSNWIDVEIIGNKFENPKLLK